MEWTQIKVSCKREDLEALSAVMCMLDNGLMIEDYSDIEENLMPIYGELIDDKILNADKNAVSVSIFVPEERSYTDYVAYIRERLTYLGLKDYNITLEGFDEEDWANAWREYYKPIHIGKSLVVVPAWQEYDAKANEVTIKMDPGMAFGTGTHETTRLCAAMVEKHMKKGDRVLDIGTGSGILSMFAVKLGAKGADAYDIDPVAVRVAKENAKENGITSFKCGVSDLLRDVDLSEGPFDFAMANIVADILIRMSEDIAPYLKDGAKIVCSGIIEGRCDEVINGMNAHGFELVDSDSENDWKVLVFCKKV